jgi:hypothetical protein
MTTPENHAPGARYISVADLILVVGVVPLIGVAGGCLIAVIALWTGGW